MSEQCYIFENAKFIRNQWLIFSIICSAYSIITDYLHILTTPSEFSSLLSIVISNAVLLFLLYHFSYRKTGTRLLTFVMFLKVLGVIGIIELFPIILFTKFKILNYSLTTIDLFLMIAWCSLSLQLRKMNMTSYVLTIRNKNVRLYQTQ
jgi:hypothetical protein